MGFLLRNCLLLGLYSIHRMAMIKEGGGEPDKLPLRDVLMEARRSTHGLSSAAGLLRIVRAPFLCLRTTVGLPAEHPEKDR